MNVHIPSNFTTISKCFKLHDKCKFLEPDICAFKYSVKLNKEFYLCVFPTASEVVKLIIFPCCSVNSKLVSLPTLLLKHLLLLC